MKRLLALTVALLSMTATLHAVMVGWELQYSDLPSASDGTTKWWANDDGGVDSGKVFLTIVYVAEVEQADVASVAAAAAAKHNKTLVDANGNAVTALTGTTTYKTDGLAMEGSLAINRKDVAGDGAGGWYYVVAFDATSVDDNNNVSNYAVAGTYWDGTSYNSKDATTGFVKNEEAGNEPSQADFADLTWIGGTWKASMTPEPTAITLLALGVAGLALRRKVR